MLPDRKEMGRGRWKKVIPDKKPREGWEEGRDPRDFSYILLETLSTWVSDQTNISMNIKKNWTQFKVYSQSI